MPAKCLLGEAGLGTVLRETVKPDLDRGYFHLLIALIGTTISPYMQLYVQSSVVEKGVTSDDYRYTRFDVIAGTLAAGIVAVFIIIATAATLYPQGIQIETAADAARALEPVGRPLRQAPLRPGPPGSLPPRRRSPPPWPPPTC